MKSQKKVPPPLPAALPGVSSPAVPVRRKRNPVLLKKLPLLGVLLLGSFLASSCRQGKLSADEKAVLGRILAHWETWVPAKKADGTAPLIDFGELEQGLGPEEQALLSKIRDIRIPGRTYLGVPAQNTRFIRIEETVTRNGREEPLGPQYLPEPVHAAYQTMMAAMEKDLGKRLRVDSGYRSPAYQLYTFLFFMPKHDYSVKATREWVALPGYSEHGNPALQAIDFINAEGINGEERAEDFEALPEYAWLQRNAADFGFELSYPRGTKGTTFEPWHWRFCNRDCKISGSSGADRQGRP